MDKKSKEALRRYKKSRQHARSSSDSSSSSDSDSGSSDSSYSSSENDRKAAERHRKKKARQAAAGVLRRATSSSADERRKREKREHCQKKLEAKRNHLKRKLKEAKLKKRAAAAAAALSGHSHRSFSPATQAKLKKLAERKHQRTTSKERRERDREKHRSRGRDREREREHHRTGSRSPTKITKIRIHQDVKRQKSPTRVHHQLMSREKIIIQTRTRDRTPSAERERQRHEHKLRHDDLARERERRERERERAEREAARDKERAEALARCQERQRERERLAREKMRREEEEKKYGSLGVERSERILPRAPEREIAIAARVYGSRERSMDSVERSRHVSKRELEAYEREREYLEAERRGLLEREELRREREYLAARRRELSPVDYATRIRDPRDLYPEEERERAYSRVAYLEDARHVRDRDAWLDRDLRERELHDLRDPRDYREIERDLIYPDERERLVRERERALTARGEWKSEWDVNRERDWDETAALPHGGFVGGPKRGGVNAASISKIPPREPRPPSEPDWDADEEQETGKNTDPATIRDITGFGASATQRDAWVEHDQREKSAPLARSEHTERRWPSEWREGDEITARSSTSLHLHRSDRGGRGFRRGGLDHGERSSFRPHPPPLMTLPVQPPGGFHGASPRFPSKRSMTYTNPNLIKKQQIALSNAKAAAQASAVVAATTAVAAAMAAAQSAANATTNPGILGQVSGVRQTPGSSSTTDKADVSAVDINNIKNESEVSAGKTSEVASNSISEEKLGGELSEISDSDDDILNKTEKKSKTDGDDLPDQQVGVGEGASEQKATNDSTTEVETKDTPAPPHEDEEMLDFEEISDGELEEEARHKGVGDALGVDWASLIEETKRHAEALVPNTSEHAANSKQRWKPHRIILQVGISMRMAGEDYANRVLNLTKEKLTEELIQMRLKKKIKMEKADEEDNQPSTSHDIKPHIPDKKLEQEYATEKTLEDLCEAAMSVQHFYPYACIQVARREEHLEQRNLFANACGPNSRALSARGDLKLRRQLCGLPGDENDVPWPLTINKRLKAVAMDVFQRTLQVH